MKQIILSIFAFALFISVSAQSAKTDTVAIMILDQMSSIIGDLTSTSFKVETRSDVIDRNAGLTTQFNESEVFFDGPDRMLVNSNGNKGHRGLWYNGEHLVYYSYDENNYAIIETPPTSIETIDSIYEYYGIEFPAADFFYPTFTEDLLAHNNEIIFDGLKTIGGQECFHIIARGSKATIQLFITNASLYLPYKMIIINHDKDNHLQYEATFSKWQINPILPGAMFEFLPPPGAHEVAILPRK